MKDPTHSPASLKVSAVARRTGVSVRTLHYYEEIGLLAPSARTAAGHRLYTPGDIAQLQQIRSLGQLGLPLSDIGDCLRSGEVDGAKIISDHLSQIRSQRQSLEKLEKQLTAIAEGIERGTYGDAFTTETLLNAVESITMYDKYFTPEQLQILKAHSDKGEDAVSPSIEALEAARQKGLPPSDPEAQRLLQRFYEAIESVTGGDDAMKDSILNLLHAEKQARLDHGISEELFVYLGSISAGDHAKN